MSVSYNQELKAEAGDTAQWYTCMNEHCSGFDYQYINEWNE